MLLLGSIIILLSPIVAATLFELIEGGKIPCDRFEVPYVLLALFMQLVGGYIYIYMLINKGE